jgi:hypothetical protein
MLDLARVGAAGAGQDRAAAMALEQRDAEELLEMLDLVADGGGRDAEFVGALGETAVAGRGLERQQGLERRKPGAARTGR